MGEGSDMYSILQNRTFKATADESRLSSLIQQANMNLQSMGNIQSTQQATQNEQWRPISTTAWSWIHDSKQHEYISN